MAKKLRKPYKIEHKLTKDFRNRLTKLGLYPTLSGFEIYVTNTKRGWCRFQHKDITIPLWAFVTPLKNDKNYSIYYVCHELAHSITGKIKGTPHGPKFMAEFIKICPSDLQHFELEYKPKNAKTAGIKEKTNDCNN